MRVGESFSISKKMKTTPVIIKERDEKLKKKVLLQNISRNKYIEKPSECERK